jgi:hypothetical protein
MQDYLPTYVLVFLVVSFLLAFPAITYTMYTNRVIHFYVSLPNT